MNDINLSTNFSYTELTRTEHTDLLAQNQQEGLQFISSLTSLCISLLEPIRLQWGPLHINSGFRCASLNAAVGSHPTSQHLIGQAADFIVKDLPEGKTLIDVFNWIYQESNLDFHQLIFEGGIWLHVSFPLGVNDNQIMDYDINTKTYTHLDKNIG